MIFSVIYFAVFFGIFSLLLYFLFRENWQKTVVIPAEKVPVSILIAARNEEQNIIRCLEAITKLNYPAEKLEVLIGDDHSTDQTHQLVAAFIEDKPNFRLIKIGENLGQAKGKANVLAYLTQEAKSNYFFITDADIEVPTNWINAMLAQLSPKTGIVTGITTTNGSNFFSRMQGLDWLNALGFIQVVADRGLPVTTMGNNMLITREAYESTGGYENFPFSITEDVQLFREVLKRGYNFRNVYQADVLALTQPAPDLLTFLHQRKRWMRGSMHLPLYMKLVLIIYTSFYFVLIPFFWRAPLEIAGSLFLLKIVYQSVFLGTCFKRLHSKSSILDFLWFEGYQFLMSVLLVIYFFLPFKIRWKDRTY